MSAQFIDTLHQFYQLCCAGLKFTGREIAACHTVNRMCHVFDRPGKIKGKEAGDDERSDQDEEKGLEKLGARVKELNQEKEYRKKQ
ncbi:hypothetical protein OfM2_20430 [Lactovum odontotermitis]